MVKEQLAFHSSPIHRLDPAVRIIAAVLISFTAALCRNVEILGAFGAVSLGLVFFAAVPPATIMGRLKPLLGFLLMIWLLLPITYEGPAMAAIGPFTITRPGVELCMAITMKSITVLLVFMSLIATMTVATMGQTLYRLHVPDKLIFLLLMTYRYIAVIEEEYNRLLRAARFRGFRPGTNLHSYRTYAYLAGMLFVRASLRARRVHQAMLCRGFNGRFHTLASYSPTVFNALFLAGTAVVTAALAGMEIYLT